MGTNNKIDIFPLIVMGLVLILTNSCKKDKEPAVIKDGDGNVYTSVTIGTQIWIVENLKTTKFNDGSSIPLVPGVNEWQNLITSAYCVGDPDDPVFTDTYGAYYNWYAVNTGKLCPSGWHVPTDVEWTTLITFLGGEAVAGGKLKEKGTTHWMDPNVEATNETGFSAVGSGFRDSGVWSSWHWSSLWWSATEESPGWVWLRYLNYDTGGAYRSKAFKSFGLSIRCVKDY